MLSNYYYQNILLLHSSEEATAGSGGDRPVRNILIERNGEGGTFPRHFFYSDRLCLKKCSFVRRKKQTEYGTKKQSKNQLLTRKKVNVFQDKT
jgi:hypothetical protein